MIVQLARLPGYTTIIMAVCELVNIANSILAWQLFWKASVLTSV